MQKKRESVLRRTKIVATLGPSTDDPETLYEMCRAGLDVARVNFSHGTHEDQLRRIETLRVVAARAGRFVGVLADLAGPKIRIESFVDGKIMLVDGASFVLDPTHDPRNGNAEVVGVAYPDLPRDVRKGDTLLLNDGLITLEVREVRGTRIHCTVIAGGELSNRKGVNRKGGGISAGALTDKDRLDIRFVAANKFDFVALSFVRDAEDVREAKALLRDAGSDARVIAKIERHEAIEELDAIIVASDGLMVARGDLGVEMGYAEITGLQKTIIERSRAGNRIVITATQMMESMIQNPVPTRAEVSDVANAVMDGTDAVMLSAETASGKHPLKAVQAMADVIEGAEKYQVTHGRALLRVNNAFENTEEAIAMAVMYTANHMRVRAIVALTESGSTPLWMSRIRSDIPIYAFTRQEATRRRVTLYRGVYPIPFDVIPGDVQTLYGSIFALLLKMGLVETGDLVILTKGELSGVTGGTNSMQILAVTRH